MKKILLIAAFAVFGLTSTQAQEVKEKAKKEVKKAKKAKKETVAEVKPVMPQVQGPGMVFESESIDYGTIEQGADGNRQFVLTNNGTEPLIITNAQGSCGCTVPTFPKEPIAPGAKAVIGVKYDTNRPGAINKSVTITSNAKETPTKVVTIKGMVNAKPVAPATPTAPSITTTPAAIPAVGAQKS